MDQVPSCSGLCATDMAKIQLNASRMAADATSPNGFSLVSINYPTAVLTLLLGYVVACSYLRFRFEKAMIRRFNYSGRASLAGMSSNDAQSIIAYLMTYEFPYIYKTALQFAIFKVRRGLGVLGKEHDRVLTRGRHTALKPCLDSLWLPRASRTQRLQQRGKGYAFREPPPPPPRDSC